MVKVKKINIFFGIDDNYVWPFLVSIYSAKRNYIDLKQINIAFDTRHLSVANQDFISVFLKKINVKTKFHEIDLGENTKEDKHLTHSAFLRLFIPNSNKKTIVWFDSDIIFLKGWGDLLNFAKEFTELDATLAARKHWPWTTETNEKNLALKKNGELYFNSGVLVINSKEWNAKDLTNVAKALISDYVEMGFEWGDQCVLNYMLGDSYVQLDNAFNSTQQEYLPGSTRILHFAGTPKPWRFRLNHQGKIVKHDVDLKWEYLTEQELLSNALYTIVEMEVASYFEEA